MSPTAGDDSESGTDSSPDRPYESLYRRADGEVGEPIRPTPRHFESSLSRPEEAETGYGWLFRDDTTEQVGAAEADISTAGRSIAPVPEAEPFGHVGAATLAGALAPAAVPPTASPAPATPRDGALAQASVAPVPVRPAAGSPGGPRSAGPRRRWWIWLLVIAMVFAVGFGIYRLVGPGIDGISPRAGQTPISSRPDPTENSPAANRESSSGATPYAGSVAAVVQKSTDADCQAPDAQDGGGARVSYDPGNVGDRDPATAWRCDGATEGSILTLTLPEDTRIAEVGLINGYAKIDPKSGDDRYGEYRRVTRVSWIFDDGTTISQTLTDGLETLQRMRIDPVTSTSVQLRIDSSTDPGSSRKTRDAVLISEVSVASPT